MTCDATSSLLPDFLQGSLDEKARGEVEAHLKDCAECRAEVDAWEELGSLPEITPSPELRTRFSAMLEAHRAEQTASEARGWRRFLRGGGEPMSLRLPAIAAVWTLVVLGTGFFAGRLGRPDATEIAATRAELSNMRQLAVLSMLQQQLASQRLQGVSFSRQQERSDPAIIAALLHTLQFDTSVDVRLASVDALAKFARQPDAREGLTRALQVQNSPLVQAALIDVLVDLKDHAATEDLRRFRERPDLVPAVRQHVDWGISQL
jgi:hypothetical protein